MMETIKRLQKVFGVVNICPAVRCEKNMDSINKTAVECMKSIDCAGKTFKSRIKTRRQEVSFEFASNQQGSRREILKNVKGLKVDVHNPDITVQVEIRGDAYVLRKNSAAQAVCRSAAAGELPCCSAEELTAR